MKTNALKATAYQGRANFAGMDLLVEGVLVPSNTVSRAVARLESEPPGSVYCVDSQVDSDIISLTNNATHVSFQPGLISNIPLGQYWVYLTIFDTAHPEGFAWGASLDQRNEFYDEPAMFLKMARWPMCS
jgi:hypothetical protein